MTATLLLILATAALLGWWIGRARGARVAVPFALGVACIGAAWLDIAVPFRARPVVNLLVDLSPSTRGMWFREIDAVRDVESRLRVFADVRTYAFADGNARPLMLDRPLEEINVAASRFPQVGGGSIVLLSDGQLVGSHGLSKVFPIVDEEIAFRDARIVNVVRDESALIARTESTAPDSELIWPDGTRDPIAPGESIFRHDAAIEAAEVAIASTRPDLWPENDRLRFAPSRSSSAQRWIGPEAPAPFIPTPNESIDLEGLLDASVVVLNDMPIESLSRSSQETLARYVRDLGGSLILGGGERSLSAGGYGNTVTDALSPLASLPPAPANELFVLVDSSGSMAAEVAAGRTKLDEAVDAAAAIGRIVPETWPIRAGSIARDLRWWPVDGTRAKRPSDLVAGGPTNLGAAIEQVMALGGTIPKRMIVISDGQVPADSLTSIAPRLSEKSLTIDWLALPGADANGALARLVETSGGTMLPVRDAASWRGEAETLARDAVAEPMIDGPFDVALEPVGRVSADRVNSTFLREGATPLASVRLGASDRVVAGTWNVGVGRVTTLAFALDPAALGEFALANQRLPHDPRFRTRTSPDALEIEARDAKGPMNGLRPELRLDDSVTALPLEQIAPGRYRVGFARSDRPRIGSVRLADASLDAVLIPASYPAEFESIGLNVSALRELATATGGRVFRRDEIATLGAQLRSNPARSARVPFAVGGFALISLALVLSRRAGHTC